MLGLPQIWQLRYELDYRKGMHLDPLLPVLVATTVVILTVGLLLQLFKQPQAIGYLLAGILIGPHSLSLFTNTELVSRLGGFGVVLLLFFVGMDVAPRKIASVWQVAVIGTLIQVTLSVAMVLPLGLWLEWPLKRVVLLGFVTSLSSTAVIIKLMQDSGEIHKNGGQDILGILLVQDLIVIPMLIVIGLLGGEKPGWDVLGIQICGAGLTIGILSWVMSRDVFHLPGMHMIRENREIQVFAALLICLGFSLLTGLANLSTALGGFAAGILVAAAQETQWVRHALEPFRVIFVALFFVSIGLLVDIPFITAHSAQVTLLVLIVLLSNTFLNGLTLRMLGYRWREGLYAGAMLSQIGEFSFVLAAVGLSSKIISDVAYQYTIAVIALTLIISPFWIQGARKLLGVPRLFVE